MATSIATEIKRRKLAKALKGKGIAAGIGAFAKARRKKATKKATKKRRKKATKKRKSPYMLRSSHGRKKKTTTKKRKKATKKKAISKISFVRKVMRKGRSKGQAEALWKAQRARRSRK